MHTHLKTMDHIIKLDQLLSLRMNRNVHTSFTNLALAKGAKSILKVHDKVHMTLIERIIYFKLPGNYGES